MPSPSRRVVLLVGLVLASASLTAQRIATPRDAFGFDIGDDYWLATYTQLHAYWAALAAASPRMTLDTIGVTAEGRHQLMAIITSPENHRRLARLQEISRRLALAEGLTDEQAAALAAEGRAVVWIDGGLHATEVLGAHQLMELVYQLVSRDDPETRRILDEVVVLAVHANPDGMELVSSWYMRQPDTLKRNSGNIPRLYQKYIGHDNNRDFYAVTQLETENMARVLFREWLPQIVYNHHQTGPAGTVMFAPPFRDPFNYHIDPLVILGIDALGAAMHGRFVAEGKPGTTMRRGASYSNWWNGGLRTSTDFHNMIGLLTETIGNPTPVTIPFVPDRQLPKGDQPLPIGPQAWRFRQSIDYSITANRAVLDYASRYRETLLLNIYRMGRNSIDRGSRDSWTTQPRMIEAVRRATVRDSVRPERGRRRGVVPDRYFTLLRDSARRDPRGYILPADQPDFPTATKFVNALVKNGITVERATRAFETAGRRYPAGSFVARTAQAFRPHILDMFEPQDHPDDFEYPGGPPIAPYDNAGYTLALQMGVAYDRVLEGLSGPFERLEGHATPPPGTIAGAVEPERAAGFVTSHRVNDAAIVTNRLLAAKVDVQWLTESIQANGRTYPAGTIYLPARSGLAPLLRAAATQLGVTFEAVAQAPTGTALRLRPARVGLWDRYGGSMPSGWTRWLLERFEFPFEVVYPQTLDAGRLSRRFDVLILPDGAVPTAERDDEEEFTAAQPQPQPASIPPAYRAWLGHVTAEKTVPQLRQFLADGGTIIAIGRSTALAHHLGLPVADHLAEDGRHLARSTFYVPGSILEVSVDPARPVAYGMPERVDVFFDNSPVLRLLPGAEARGVRPVAWFASAAPLRSGWAWGQRYLKDGIAIAEAEVGQGRLYLCGPEILFRGQPHGTFKFLFNGIHLARALPANRRPDAQVDAQTR